MKTNPRKTAGMKLLGNVDVKDLAKAVAAIPEDIWDIEDAGKPNKFDALDRTKHIIFRFVKSMHSHEESYDLKLWAEWSGLILPVMEQATRSFGYKRYAYPRVMLARMDPGGIIHPHVDASTSAGFPHKIHVPLQTNSLVEFYIEPNTYHFEVGKAYEVNNRVLHAVRNRGETARIHLIFEYYDLDQPTAC
jgi:Aspartyl/Asparaginyl beta-hydroxylase